MKIYIEDTDSDVKTLFFVAIAEVNKKLGLRQVQTELLEPVFIPRTLQRTQMIPSLISDYAALESNSERVRKLEKLESAIKTVKGVFNE